jgi:methionyl aminopeptidase
MFQSRLYAILYFSDSSHTELAIYAGVRPHVQSILITLIQRQKSHKVIHDLVKGTITQKWPDGSSNPWPTHKYHGSLRPRYPLSPKREVPAHIRRPDYADHEEGETWRNRFIWNGSLMQGAGVPLSEVKADRYMYPPKILNKEEQAKMRAVCRVRR